jgi:hypothetical protein
MFRIALAAAVSAAPPDKDVRSLFSYEDVPLELIHDGEWRRVGVRVTVEPTGKIQSCRTEFSSGVPKLDIYTCAIIDRRARFSPQVTPDGQPVFSVVRANVTYRVDASAPPESGDLELTVSKLPDGVRDPAFVMMRLLVDESGHPTSCIGENSNVRHSAESPPQLLQVACDQLLKSYTAIPARDASGRPVRSMQDALVRFSLGQRQK